LAIGIRAVLRFVLLSGLGAPCLLIRFVLLLSDALVVLALHGKLSNVHIPSSARDGMLAANIANDMIKINEPLQRFDFCFPNLSKMFIVSLIAYGILGLAIAVQGEHMSLTKRGSFKTSGAGGGNRTDGPY